MKATKKLFALVLALVMAMALSVTAFAASIEITGNEGETYYAYKVLDVSVAGEADEDGNYSGYNYTTSSQAVANILQQYGYTVTQSSAGTLWYVSLGTSTDADGLTKYLASLSETQLVTLLSEAVDNVTLDGETGTIDELDAGYYFVTSTLGSLCMLSTAADTAEVNDKNEEPTVDKEVDKTDAQIGDTVTYTVTITVPANTESLKLTDTLSNGLTLNGTSFEIVIDNGEAVDLNVSDITKNEDGTTTFTIDLTDYLEDVDSTITITYTATINENAVASPATNEAVISYGNSSSVSSTTSTKTSELTINKTDESGNALDGAKFTLERKVSEGTDTDPEEWEYVYVVPVYSTVEEGSEDEPELLYYRVATAAEIEDAENSGANTTIEVNGSVVIKGLDLTSEYRLEEIEAPDGYNLLTGYTEVKATTTGEGDDAVTAFSAVTVKNSAGSLLPSTGGMGTTVIYIVGALLVIGAGIVLVVRRRMNAE